MRKRSAYVLSISKVCLATLLIAFLTVVANAAPPKLIMFSPAENAISVKEKVLFKGKAEGAKSVYINDKEVELDKTGRFYTKIELSIPNTYHYFVVKAESKEGEITKVSRKIYYKTSEITQVKGTEEVKKPFIQLTSPPENLTTTKPKIIFSGKAFGANAMTLNGVTLNLNKEGEFTYRHTLKKLEDYENFEIVGYAKDPSIRTVIKRKVFYKSKRAKGIALIVESPDDKYVSTKQEVVFKGKVEAADAILVNGYKVAIQKNGTFSYTGMLKKENDYNAFEFIAQDDSGKKVSVVREIYYKINQLEPLRLSKDDVDPSAIEHKIPTIVVKSPQNNFVTYKNVITIQGVVANAEELFINSRVVKLDKKGRFSEAFEMDAIGKYVFNMYAIGKSGLHTTELLKLFKISETPDQVTEGDDKTSPVLVKKLMKKISLDLAGADIRDVMNILARKGDLNLVTDKTLVGEIYISLQEVTILDAIDFVLGSQGFNYKIVGNTLMLGSKAALDQPTRLETKIVRLNNVNAATIQTILKEHLVTGENIQVQQNLLIITADSKKVGLLTGIVKKLDAEKTPQIILEAQILEVSKSILDNLGVSWSDTYGVGVQATGTDGAYTYSTGFSLATVISMLESEGKARVLAKPRIKAIHGEQAEIFIGDKVPYIELTVGAAGTVAESVAYVDSGINLTILPEINIHTQEIKIKISPEVSYINGYKGDNNDIPIVRTRRVNTTVFVKNGNTVLIGGLFNSSDSDTVSRFPFLSRIPLVGILFKTNKVEQDQTELVIAITPQIINEDFKESIPLPIDTKLGLAK